jgi:hypothetical protein
LQRKFHQQSFVNISGVSGVRARGGMQWSAKYSLAGKIYKFVYP